jgi:hypothetical protein
MSVRDRIKNLKLRPDPSPEAKKGHDRLNDCGFTPEEIAAAPPVELGDDPDGDG